MTCRERAIEIKELETQILSFLRGISVDHRIHDWLIEEFHIVYSQVAAINDANKQSLENARSDVSKQHEELTGLRLRNLISDQEYITQLIIFYTMARR